MSNRFSVSVNDIALDTHRFPLLLLSSIIRARLLFDSMTAAMKYQPPFVREKVGVKDWSGIRLLLELYSMILGLPLIRDR